MKKEYSILVVDDEAIIRNTISCDLKDEGYNVILAENGEEALRLLTDLNEGGYKPKFDLVITDMVMEGLDGIGILKKVKEISPETGVIILTGYGDLQSTISAFKHSADDYILKPCDPEELLLRVARCLEKLEMQRLSMLYEKVLMICLMCKKVHYMSGDEQGSGKWVELEEYINVVAKVDISFDYCPECLEKEAKEA